MAEVEVRDASDDGRDVLVEDCSELVVNLMVHAQE